MKLENVGPVANPDLRKAITEAKKSPGVETSVKLLNEVVKAKLLAPVSMDQKPEYDEEIDEIVINENTQISFELIKSSNGSLYYPVFTDGPEMALCGVDMDQQSLIVNFDDLAAMLLQPQNAVAGFVINPMNDNICFSTDMIAAMKKDMEKEKKENGK